MSLIDHVKQELLLAGYTPLDQPQENDPCKWIQENIIALTELFASQGHSGMSAPYLVNMIDKLWRYKTLTPLTGADDEWFEREEGYFQNKRCGAVFKNGKDGPAYYLDGLVFIDQDGGSFTNEQSRTLVKFPYTPETQYVHIYVRPEKEETVAPLDDSTDIATPIKYGAGALFEGNTILKEH